MNQFVDVVVALLTLYVTGWGFLAFGRALGRGCARELRLPERRARKAAKRLGRLGE